MSKLAETLLRIQERPGTYFRGERSIYDISAFITGFEHGDEFRSDALSFGSFTQWVVAQYRITTGPRNGFSLILERVGEDECLAFDEFFRLLPAYIRDLDKIGDDGITARFHEVMVEIRKNPGV